MFLFLDTEFTGLVARPCLLAVGLVAEATAGGEFYAEVTDAERLADASWFARGAVLPQFGRLPGAACPYLELGCRVAAFFEHQADLLGDGESIDLAYGHPLDWELLEQAVADAGIGADEWAGTRRRVRPASVYEIVGHGPGEAAAEAYFKTQASALLSRHHALCDARALRLAWQAATAGGHDPRGARSLAPHGAMGMLHA